MSVTAVYVLDTSALIQAARTYYAFDIAPTFWPHLVRLVGEGSVISIDKVKREILRGTDDLAAWTQSDFSDAFVSTQDPAVFYQYQDMMLWSQNHVDYTPAAKSEFAGTDNADPWVMAYAHVKGGIVVSAEEFKLNRKKKILIPNACKELGIPFSDLFEMLRTLRVRL